MIVVTNDLTDSEHRLLEILTRLDSYTEIKFEAANPRREFDIRITGNNQNGLFSLILFRAAVKRLTNWTSPEIAKLTDHPEMCLEGDWSGVRDTDDVKLWNIFNRFVLPMLKVVDKPKQEVVRVFGKDSIDLIVKDIISHVKSIESYSHMIRFQDWSIAIRPDGTFIQMIYTTYDNKIKHHEVELT